MRKQNRSEGINLSTTSLSATNQQRLSFAKLNEVLSPPSLLDIQRQSFDWLMGSDAWKARVAEAEAKGRTDVPMVSGLEEIFEEISPITDFAETMSLSFTDPKFESPTYTVEECKAKGYTYSAAMYVTANFMYESTGEVKAQTIFMGDFPLMTPRATFIINGTERVVVSQLVRSPGVYFEKTADKGSDRDIYGAKFIPSRGAWLEFEIDRRENVGIRIDRRRKQSATIFLRALGMTEAEIREEFADYPLMINTLEKDADSIRTVEDAQADIYRKIRPGEPASAEAGRSLLESFYFNPKRYDLAKVGRYKVNRKLGLNSDLSESTLTLEDIVTAFKYLLALQKGETTFTGVNKQGEVIEMRLDTDDIDHFGNRRIRAVGELIQAQLRTGLSRMERVVRERMTTQEAEAITPLSLINIRPVVAAVKEFFGTSQLSQFMDQNNPLSGMTQKRRLSALGPGGLSRDRAGMEVRDVHPSHYGRMCPIESPEGPNIGLIGSLATFARINPFGFLETPYRVVKDGKVTEEVYYMSADEEAGHNIAQASAKLDENGHFLEDMVLCRIAGHDPALVPVEEVDFMDVSTRQMTSVGASLIPFLEHDDANRALMGANMQRQAVPLLQPEEPLVGTGMEALTARDSGEMLLAHKAGVVTEVDAQSVTIMEDDGHYFTYKLDKFTRSNAGNCYNQRICVKEGDRIEAGGLLADGPATNNGELALGKNLLVAYMSWEGLNYEDAIILSRRVVQDDLLTSIHIEEHEVDTRSIKIPGNGKQETPEMITADIPHVSPRALTNLDERGIVRIGAEVTSGDILVGKVTPKGEVDHTAEKRLLNAIFNEQNDDYRDTSLRVPHGESGIVIGVREFNREDDELAPGVLEMVRVYVAQRRKITIGDKLAGRHGNKGVVSKILPIEDMPFLEDGTPVDIILNPMGVPGRMNIGQVLEFHLGWIAHQGWDATKLAEEGQKWVDKLPKEGLKAPAGQKVATPVFDGCTEDELTGLLGCTLPNEDGMRLIDKDGKARLFDGRSGEPFPYPISVGYKYMLKLHHLVEDKIHARSTGPYSMITQQPLGGKAQFGGQRFGEMEVWAMEAYGAAYSLQELLTVKSDDITGRVKVYEAIVKGEDIPEAGIPESFRVLIEEMRSLCLNVEALDAAGNVVSLADKDEDEADRAREEMGIDIGSRPNPNVSIDEF